MTDTLTLLQRQAIKTVFDMAVAKFGDDESAYEFMDNPHQQTLGSTLSPREMVLAGDSKRVIAYLQKPLIYIG